MAHQIQYLPEKGVSPAARSRWPCAGWIQALDSFAKTAGGRVCRAEFPSPL